jgi:hypothetical protein
MFATSGHVKASLYDLFPNHKEILTIDPVVEGGSKECVREAKREKKSIPIVKKGPKNTGRSGGESDTYFRKMDERISHASGEYRHRCG